MPNACSGARKAAGLSMSKLAEEVGVSANAIKKYEHGINIPSSNNLLKMANALNVRTEYFFRPIEVELQQIEYRKKSQPPKETAPSIDSRCDESG